MRGDRAIRTVQSMTITPVQQSPDTATVERLAAAFNRSFETCEDPDEILSPDVFFDLYPPFWRFQLQGRDAIQAAAAQAQRGLRGHLPDPARRPHRRRLPPGARGDLPRRAHRDRPQALALRRARRPDRRGDLLLQRRMGRRAARSPRRRSPDAATLRRGNDDDHPRHDDRRDGAPGRPPTGAVDLRPSERDRSGPTGASRPGRRAAGRRLLPARAPGDARRVSRHRSPTRCARSSRWPGPTRRSPGP